MKKMFGKQRGGYPTGAYKGSLKNGQAYSGSTWRREGASEDRPRMHPATCSKCGAECEVPFKPNGVKPVSCSNCFVKKDGASTPSRYGAPRSERPRPFASDGDRRPEPHPRSEVAEQLRALNQKMDRLLDVLTELAAK